MNNFQKRAILVSTVGITVFAICYLNNILKKNNFTPQINNYQVHQIHQVQNKANIIQRQNIKNILDIDEYNDSEDNYYIQEIQLSRELQQYLFNVCKNYKVNYIVENNHKNNKKY